MVREFTATDVGEEAKVCQIQISLSHVEPDRWSW